MKQKQGQDLPLPLKDQVERPLDSPQNPSLSEIPVTKNKNLITHQENCKKRKLSEEDQDQEDWGRNIRIRRSIRDSCEASGACKETSTEKNLTIDPHFQPHGEGSTFGTISEILSEKENFSLLPTPNPPKSLCQPVEVDDGVLDQVQEGSLGFKAEKAELMMNLSESADVLSPEKTLTRSQKVYSKGEASRKKEDAPAPPPSPTYHYPAPPSPKKTKIPVQTDATKGWGSGITNPPTNPPPSKMARKAGQ